jgi:hypothetical protein
LIIRSEQVDAVVSIVADAVRAAEAAGPID